MCKKMKLIMSLCLSMTVCSAFSQSWSEFKHVPDSTRTKVWWFHGDTETTQAGITADLEAFRQAGIGGVVYYDQSHGEGKNALPGFSPEWWKMFVFAAQEAHRLGLSFETHLSNGYVAGGPWIKENEGMKYLVSGDTLVHGGKTFSGVIRIPYNRGTYRKDVAVLAFPVRKNEWTRRTLLSDTVLTDVHQQHDIDVDMGTVFTARSMTYDVTQRGRTATRCMNAPGKPAEQFFGMKYTIEPAVGELMVSNDGIHYQTVCIIKPIYETNAVWSGQTISFPAVSGRYFRLRLHDWCLPEEKNQSMKIKFMRLNSQAETDLWEEKAGLVSNHIFSNDTPDYAPQEVIHATDIINITDKMDSKGVLTWKAPKGDWVLMRFAVAPTLARTRHGRRNLLGLECDKMNAEAATITWKSYFKVMDDTLRAHHLKIDGLAMDSHEAGAQNWTEGMEYAFRSLRGYDLMRVLPVMAGYVVDSKECTDTILYDVRRTIADQISRVYFGTLDSLCRAHGTPFTAQAIGNGLCIVGDPIQAKSYVIKPESEFWQYQADGNYDVKECSSAAHIYNKPIASAEAFTDAHYSDPLGSSKTRADHAWCMGINEFVVCASAYQPWLDKFPGNTVGGRQYSLNRNNSYWPYSKPFWDYQARGNYLMRQGKAMIDFCVYLGGDAPVKIEAYRLPDIPKGFDFDAFTTDALVKRMDADSNGAFIPGCMRYKLMILPREGLRTPQELARITQLIKKGMTAYCERKNFIDDLEKGYTASTYPANVKVSGVKQIGKGRLYWGMSLSEAVNKMGLQPDVDVKDSPSDKEKLMFCHRQTADTDIYLLDNHNSEALDAHLALRSKHPYLQRWNPDTGERTALKGTSADFQCHLAANESTFIVCTDHPENIPADDCENQPQTLAELNGKWRVDFDPKWGGKGEETFDSLYDWTQSSEPAVKYYSGTAVYTREFKCNGQQKARRVYLQFSRLCDIADVELNGKNVGIVWCAPYEIDVTDQLRRGSNQLKIRVANSLVNRMIRDESLPLKDRITYAYPSIAKATDHLLPSGIIGQLSLVQR